MYTKKKVYNFEVADWHTYFVGAWEWLVHNSACVSEAIKQVA
ncbi:HINT domain-containing protein [Lacinutrix mariniflava]|nr:HINT domain-containing protein [Lacinutrix mariniflava]